MINLDSEGLEMADVTEILLRPTGYSAVYPGTSPLSFARYLETPWTDVIIEPWQEGIDLHLAVLDAHESSPQERPPAAQPKDLILLARLSNLRSARPWFEVPGRFTHAILDPETATVSLEME